MPFELGIVKPVSTVAKGVLGDLTKTAMPDLRAEAASAISGYDATIAKAGGYYAAGARAPMPVTVTSPAPATGSTVTPPSPPTAPGRATAGATPATATTPPAAATTRPAASGASTSTMTPAEAWIATVLSGDRAPVAATTDATTDAATEAATTFDRVAEFWGVSTSAPPTSTRSAVADTAESVTIREGDSVAPTRAASESATPYLDAAGKRPAESFGERTGRWIDAAQPSEHPFSATIGRTDTPIDGAITRAVASGDPVKVSAAEYVLEVLDTVINRNLQGDPFYAPYRSGGVRSNVPPGQLSDELLSTVERPGDGFGGAGAYTNAQRTTLTNRLNSIARQPFEQIAEFEQYVRSVMPLVRMNLDDTVDLPSVPRIHVADVTPTSFVNESATWLIREFITTPDVNRARQIFDILKDTRRQADGSVVQKNSPVILVTPGGKPYASQLLRENRPEALRRIRELRSEYQTLITESPESFYTRIGRTADAMFRPPVYHVHPHVMAATGFGGSLKRAGKDAAKWFQGLQPKAGVPDFSDITDWRLRWLGEQGKIGRETAEYGDRVIDWRPPAGTRDMYGGRLPSDYVWRVGEAVEWAHWYKNEDTARRALMTPEELARTKPFDLHAELRTLGERAHRSPDYPNGLPVNPTKAERAAATKAMRGYDGSLAAIRNIRLFGPISGVAGLINDIIGTNLQLVVAGHADTALMNILQPWNLGQFTMAYRSMGRDPQRYLQAFDSPIHVQTGELFPADLAPMTTRGEVPYSGKPWLNEKLGGAPLVKHLANIGSVPAIKDLRVMGSDLIPRATLYESVYQKTITGESLSRFHALLRETYGDTWQAEYRKITAQANHDFGKAWGGHGYMTPQQVIDATGNVNLGKAWQAEINRAQRLAKNETERVLFSGKSTNLDEIARRTFLFHYWQTRASMFYIRQSLRNPVMLNLQWRMLNELQEISEEQNMPGWAGSMIRFLRFGNGVGAAFNPWSYLFPAFIFDMSDMHGNKMAALTHMLTPQLQWLAAAAGMHSNTPGLDPFRPTEKFIQNLLNWGKAEGIDFEGVPVIGKYFNNDSLDFTYASDDLINAMTGWVNEKLPGGLTFGDFNPFDRASYEQDLQITAVQQVMTDIYGADRDQWPDDVYDSAIVFVTTGQGESSVGEEANQILGDLSKTQVLGAPIAGGVVTTNEWRQSALDAQNEAFADGEISEEEQDALDNRSDATAADTQWSRTNTAYHNLGNERVKQLSETYNAIIYDPGSIEGYLVVGEANGQYSTIDPAALEGMTKEERIEFANWWLSTRGHDGQALQDYRAAQDQFMVDHPEYANYDTYKSGAYDQGLTQFRTGLASTNPNFARAMDAQAAQYAKDGITGKDLVTKLDQWAISQDGFHAAIGKPYKAGDPDPISTYDPAADYTQNPNLQFMAPGAEPTQESDKPFVIPGTRGADGVYVDLSGRTREEVAAEQNQIDEEKRRAILYKILEQNPSFAPIIQPMIAEFEQADMIGYLQEDLAQYQQVNTYLESQYGGYWNESAGEWEANASSEAERAALGLPAWVQYPEQGQLLKSWFNWLNQGNPPDYAAFVAWYYSIYGN